MAGLRKEQMMVYKVPGTRKRRIVMLEPLAGFIQKGSRETREKTRKYEGKHLRKYLKRLLTEQ